MASITRPSPSTPRRCACPAPPDRRGGVVSLAGTAHVARPPRRRKLRLVASSSMRAARAPSPQRKAAGPVLDRRQLLAATLAAAGLAIECNGKAWADETGPPSGPPVGPAASLSTADSPRPAESTNTDANTPSEAQAKPTQSSNSDSEGREAGGKTADSVPEAIVGETGKRKKTEEEYAAEAQKILEMEEAEKKQKRRKSKLQEMQEVREALSKKQVQILQREEELLEKEQTLAVLREELELERNLRDLLTKEKDKAEEQAKLAMGLCGQGMGMP